MFERRRGGGGSRGKPLDSKKGPALISSSEHCKKECFGARNVGRTKWHIDVASYRSPAAPLRALPLPDPCRYCDGSRVISITAIIPGACYGFGAMGHYMLIAGTDMFDYLWW